MKDFFRVSSVSVLANEGARKTSPGRIRVCREVHLCLLEQLPVSPCYARFRNVRHSEGSEGMNVVHIENDVHLFPKELVENLPILYVPARTTVMHELN